MKLTVEKNTEPNLTSPIKKPRDLLLLVLDIPEAGQRRPWKSEAAAKRLWTASMATPSWKRENVLWRRLRTSCVTVGTESSIYDNGLPNGPHTSSLNIIRKLMRGPKKARRDGWKNGWTLPMLCGPRSLVSVGFGMAVVTTAIGEPAWWLWLARKYWAGSLSTRLSLGVVVCWRITCVANNVQNIKTTVVVSLPLHFSEECLARGWTVTEPPTPSLVRWVAAARVCEALWSWVFMVRGSGHPCVKRHWLWPIGSEVWAVKSASGRVRTSRLCWQWKKHCMGQSGVWSALLLTTACRTTAGMWAVVLVNWDRFSSSSYTMIPSRNTGTMMRRVTSCVQCWRRETRSWMVSEEWLLHAPKEAAIPSEACSLGEAVMSLIADERTRQLFTTRGYCDRHHIDSMSTGSMSPDLGDTWHQGLRMSPQGEGGLKLDSDDDFEDENEYEDDGSYEEFDSDAESGLTSVKWARAHCGLRFVTAVLRPLFWSCVQLDQSGIMRSCTVNLLPCGSFSWQKMEVSGPACALIIVKFLVLVMVCSNQDGCRTWPPLETQESGPGLE